MDVQVERRRRLPSARTTQVVLLLVAALGVALLIALSVLGLIGSGS